MNIGMILDNEFYGDLRVENEVMALTEAGFNVFVYCFSYNGKESTEKFHNATIVKFSVSKKIIWKLRALTNTILNYYPTYLTNLFKDRIAKDNISILHVHDLFLFPVGLKLKKLFPKIKLVGDLHENYVEGLKHYKFANTFPGNIFISIPKWEKSEIEWCKQYDHLITVIEEAVERYKSLGIKKGQINVVSNYVNIKEFLPETFDEKIVKRISEKTSLIYIGGFDLHRGLESVVKAMPIILEKFNDVQLVLVGKGKNKNELIELAKELGVESKITFEGFQPAKLLPSYIEGSTICLIPHLKTVHTDNTIPHKLFHYMLLGKPVVASNCNPIKRILEKTNSGLVYEANNEKELAKKIISLLENKEMMNKFGNNGVFAVKEKYNWEETSKDLINLYKKTLTK